MTPVLSADTTAMAAAMQYKAWRSMTPTEKLDRVRELTTAVLWLEREGLRRRHPTFGPVELHRAAVARRLGAELAARVYPPSPGGP